jgi:hypothetical protein
MSKFRKPFNELFTRTGDFYKAIEHPVKIGDTIFDVDRLSGFNTLLEELDGKNVAGDFDGLVYRITSYFEKDVLIEIPTDSEERLF